jgi:hypothetical protein
LPYILRGEERLEDLRPHILSHTNSGIRNAYPDEPSLRTFPLHSRLTGNIRVGRFNGQRAPLGHSIPSVQTQIHQNLLDLHGIDCNRTKIGSRT